MASTMEPKTETPVRPAPRPSTPAPAAPPKSSRRTVFMIMGVILLGLVIFGARKWWFGRSHVSTDNAQVDGHIVPVLPKVGGYVAEVRVAENQAATRWSCSTTATTVRGSRRPTRTSRRCSLR